MGRFKKKSFFIVVGLIFFIIHECLEAKVSIITSPIGHGSSSYGGHYAVTRSCVEGLHKINADFNYNPRNISELGDTVVVLSNFDALSQAIQFKRDGRIKKLFAGPNLVILPRDNGRIIASPEIDYFFVNSDWVFIAYEQDEPRLAGRLKIWPAGVDEEYWKPIIKPEDSKDVLVYWKTESQAFCNRVQAILRKNGWNPIVIRYGSYNKEQYKNALSGSRFAVFISKSESQGIALVEAWAMDVPTLVWNSYESFVYQGYRFPTYSSCPYLSENTGLKWHSDKELESIIEEFDYKKFHPREWVVSSMTDAVSARMLLDHINCK